MIICDSFFDKDFFLINSIVWEKALPTISFTKNYSFRKMWLVELSTECFDKLYPCHAAWCVHIMVSPYCFQQELVHRMSKRSNRRLLSQLRPKDNYQGPLKAIYLPNVIKK